MTVVHAEKCRLIWLDNDRVLVLNMDEQLANDLVRATPLQFEGRIFSVERWTLAFGAMVEECSCFARLRLRNLPIYCWEKGAVEGLLLGWA